MKEEAEKARQDALDYLESIVKDEESERSDRMRAAEMILLHTDDKVGLVPTGATLTEAAQSAKP